MSSQRESKEAGFDGERPPAHRRHEVISRDAAGCRAGYYPDGRLRHYGAYLKGACVACLDLAEYGGSGMFRHGIAGEAYTDGMIEPVGPFAGSVPARSTTETLEAWVLRHVATISALGAVGRE